MSEPRGSLETDVATVGPQDVDAPGEMAPKVNKSQKGHEMVKRVRSNYPPELVILEQRDEDRPRTAALDADEVLAAAQREFGDESEDGGITKVLSARVRGLHQPLAEKAVCILWETPSGRTARGAIGYSPLSTSLHEFDRKVSAGEITEVDETDAKDLTRTVERQQDQIKRLNAKIASGEGGDPTEGSGLTPEDVKALIADAIDEKAAEALQEAEQENETLREQLEAAQNELEQAKADAESSDDDSDGQPASPETEDLSEQDAADAASTTEAEAQAGDGGNTPAEDAPADAPQGKQADLLANMEKYSDAELAALVESEKAAKRPRPKVIEGAEAVQKQREG